MQEPDSLQQLPLLKHHCTRGDRHSLADYVALGEQEVEADD